MRFEWKRKFVPHYDAFLYFFRFIKRDVTFRIEARKFLLLPFCKNRFRIAAATRRLLVLFFDHLCLFFFRNKANRRFVNNGFHLPKFKLARSLLEFALYHLAALAVFFFISSSNR